MPTKIVIKSKSGTTTPLASDLVFGELALNYNTGKLYYKNIDGSVKALNEPPPGGANSGSDADFLDGIDSDQFLRSDTNDEYTNGTLGFEPGTEVLFKDTFIVSATGTVGNITGSGPWTADITGMSDVVGLTSDGVVGTIIDATPGTGSLYGGTPTRVEVTEILGETSVRVTITGGTTPTAGTVTDVRAVGSQVKFQNSTGVSPFKVTSTTKVDNLNADLLDGKDYLYFYSPENEPTITASLQDVTDNGATTTDAIEITNTTQSNGNDGNITEGALIVRGGVGIDKDLHIKGDIHIVGEGTLRFGPYDVGATDGNLWWVRKGGQDLDPAVINGAGEQQWTAFASIKHALKYANFGDTVLVQPGEYEEIFPLYVPAGVSIRGAGLRETQIYPTIGTNSKDAFLVSGDSTISDFTVKNFFYNSGNDTGYGFRFATYSATLTSGVATVTIDDTTGLVAGQSITKISGAGAFGAAATVLSVDSLTQFTASVNHATSGAIVFSTAKMTARSTYIERCTVLTRGSVITSADPYGYGSGDAGRGALVDGSLISRDSIEAAMLFNELTFIVPNSRGVIMKNGARSEMLTSFFYFSDLAVEGVVGTTGRGMDGKTYVTIEGKAGSWTNGSILRYYDTDGTTLLASATIESISGNKITIDGSASGFAINADRTLKTITVVGNAQLDTTVKKFGSASLLLDGTGDYITVDASSDFQFDADFCVEGWFYPTDLTGNHVLWCLGTETVGSRFMCYLAGSQVTTDFYGVTLQSYTSSISLNTWTHIAVSRSGSDVKVYINGTACPETDTVSGTVGDGFFNIGSNATGGATFAGQIDEFRVTKGYSRYTGNFTAATAEFIGDIDTVLLLHFNGGDGSTVILDDGNIQQDIRCSAGGTATGITRYDRSEFAAELRTISCAFVYGNQGVKADGADVLLQLMAHNFAYIGTGADLTNDKSAVIQANEVIEVNGGKVYFNSVDQAGDFRVGDYFSVNFETGAVTFSGGSFDVNALGSITFTDGANTTTVQASGITTNNLTLSGNTLTTSSGDLTLDAASNLVVVNADLDVNGTLTVTTLNAGNVVQTEYTGGPPGTGTAAPYGSTTDYIITYTKSLTLTTNWVDTGIKNTDLPTGTYLLQIYANDTTVGGTNSNEYYTAQMSWYAGTTNGAGSKPSDEIVLHRAGGSTGGGIFLRTLRTTGADNLKLQIYSNTANSGPVNYVFKFRRMM